MKKLSQTKQTSPSKVRFADEAWHSDAPPNTTTPSTPGTDTTNVNNTPSNDNPYTDILNLVLSKIFYRTLMASLTSKDATLKEIRDCINTDNEDRFANPYIHSYWKDLHVKNVRVCVDDIIAQRNSIKGACF